MDDSTTTASTTYVYATSTEYVGVGYHDWLFVMCIFLFFVSLASWGRLFRPNYDN